MNDWAIEKWEDILSTKHVIDRASFLVASIIPLAYVAQDEYASYIAVDLEDIRKSTKFVKEGADFLVSEGYAKWLMPKGKEPKDRVCDYATIIIGTVGDLFSMRPKNHYFFESKGRITSSLKTPRVNASLGNRLGTKAEAKDEDAPTFDETVKVLDSMFENYKVFCAKIRSTAKPEKVHERIKKVIIKAKKGQRLTETDLLAYLDCVNAMVLEWLDIPTTYNIKQRQMAKTLVNRFSTEDIINGIPYFVENYPLMAKAGFEDTNIYMASFHFGKTLQKMKGRRTRGGTTKKTFENDNL